NPLPGASIRSRALPDPFLRIGILLAAYYLTAKLGLAMGAVGGLAAPVWPPTGIALVALMLFGYRLWPGIAVGAFLVNVAAHALRSVRSPRRASCSYSLSAWGCSFSVRGLRRASWARLTSSFHS